MTPFPPECTTIDEAALVLGLGLVLLGSAVMGFFETVFGSAHVAQRISGVGIVVIHTSFSPHLRAYIIAAGFLILFVWGFARVGRAIVT